MPGKNFNCPSNCYFIFIVTDNSDSFRICFYSLADMTGIPHSNQTTIEEDENLAADTCLQPSMNRRSSCTIIDCIDLESMESDMLDPTSEIDELLKKAASSLASSRTSQTSEESPKQCSEGDVSPANLILNTRKNSIGIQVGFIVVLS